MSKITLTKSEHKKFKELVSKKHDKPARPLKAILAGPLVHQIKQLGPLHRKWIASQQRGVLAKATYFDTKDSKVDLKTMDNETELLKKEFQMARGALRAGLKDHPIRMRLSTGFVITTTVTTGVTNTVTIGGVNNQLNPLYTSEWTTMAALFEEYKCLGGEFVFLYNNAVTGVSSTVDLTSTNLPVIAYDVDDGTSATGSLSLTQASQHKVLRPVIRESISTGPTIVPSEGIMHRFKWHVPKGTAVSTNQFPGTEWVDVEGVNAAGYAKFYHVGLTVTANNTGAGFVYFDLEFRCRV